MDLKVCRILDTDNQHCRLESHFYNHACMILLIFDFFCSRYSLKSYAQILFINSLPMFYLHNQNN